MTLDAKNAHSQYCALVPYAGFCQIRSHIFQVGYAYNSWIIPAAADVMMTYRREIEPDGSATETLLASEATKADRLLSEAGSGPVLIFLQNPCNA